MESIKINNKKPQFEKGKKIEKKRGLFGENHDLYKC